jgi:hypothetical protein
MRGNELVVEVEVEEEEEEDRRRKIQWMLIPAVFSVMAMRRWPFLPWQRKQS